MAPAPARRSVFTLRMTTSWHRVAGNMCRRQYDQFPLLQEVQAAQRSLDLTLL